MQPTALSMLACPVITITSTSGRSRFTRSSRSSPLLRPRNEIEQHDREVGIRQEGIHGLGRLGERDAMAVGVEDAAQRAQQQRLVIHQQHQPGVAGGRPGGVAHRREHTGGCHGTPIGPGIETLERAPRACLHSARPPIRRGGSAASQSPGARRR